MKRRRSTDVAGVLGGVLAFLFTAITAWSPVDNDRTVGALDAELRALAPELPRAGRIGYLEHVTRPDDTDVIQTFYVAQYALAPRVLVRNAELPFLVVIRDHAAEDDPRLRAYRLFDSVHGGHQVFVRIEP